MAPTGTANTDDDTYRWRHDNPRLHQANGTKGKPKVKRAWHEVSARSSTRMAVLSRPLQIDSYLEGCCPQLMRGRL